METRKSEDLINNLQWQSKQISLPFSVNCCCVLPSTSSFSWVCYACLIRQRLFGLLFEHKVVPLEWFGIREGQLIP